MAVREHRLVNGDLHIEWDQLSILSRWKSIGLLYLITGIGLGRVFIEAVRPAPDGTRTSILLIVFSAVLFFVLLPLVFAMRRQSLRLRGESLIVETRWIAFRTRFRMRADSIPYLFPIEKPGWESGLLVQQEPQARLVGERASRSDLVVLRDLLLPWLRRNDAPLDEDVLRFGWPDLRAGSGSSISGSGPSERKISQGQDEFTVRHWRWRRLLVGSVAFSALSVSCFWYASIGLRLLELVYRDVPPDATQELAGMELHSAAVALVCAIYILCTSLTVVAALCLVAGLSSVRIRSENTGLRISYLLLDRWRKKSLWLPFPSKLDSRTGRIRISAVAGTGSARLPLLSLEETASVGLWLFSQGAVSDDHWQG